MPGNRCAPGSRATKVKGDAVVRVSRPTTPAGEKHVVWGPWKEEAIGIGNCNRYQ